MTSDAVTISKRAIRRIAAVFAAVVLFGTGYGVGRLTTSNAAKASLAVKPSTTTGATAPTTTPAPTTTAAASTATTSSTVSKIDTGVEVYGNCTTPSVEPSEIVLACADYGALVQGLQWSTWTAFSATAVGTFDYNDCTPDCADGHQHEIPGTHVTLTVPIQGVGGHLVYSEIQENPEPPSFSNGPYQGGPQPLPTQRV